MGYDIINWWAIAYCLSAAIMLVRVLVLDYKDQLYWGPGWEVAISGILLFIQVWCPFLNTFLALATFFDPLIINRATKKNSPT